MFAAAYSAVVSRGFRTLVWLSSAWTRATYHYRFGRPEQAALRKRIREIAETRALRLSGIAVLLRREGWRVNVKRVHRLYRLEGLQIQLKPPRRRVMAKLRDEHAL
jgi:putative transposase